MPSIHQFAVKEPVLYKHTQITGTCQ